MYGVFCFRTNVLHFSECVFLCLQKVYFSLLEEVKKEEQTILQLKIKLKVLPFEQSLANE